MEPETKEFWERHPIGAMLIFIAFLTIFAWGCAIFSYVRWIEGQAGTSILMGLIAVAMAAISIAGLSKLARNLYRGGK